METEERKLTARDKTADPEQLKKLEFLIGKWNIEMSFKNSPENGGTGWDTYDWVDGGFFIEGHFEHVFKNGNSHKGVNILGYNQENGANVLDFFDNKGFHRRYILTVKDDVFKYIGRWERFTGLISSSGNKIQGTWEQSDDGEQWDYLCDLKQTKVM